MNIRQCCRRRRQRDVCVSYRGGSGSCVASPALLISTTESPHNSDSFTLSLSLSPLFWELKLMTILIGLLLQYEGLYARWLYETTIAVLGLHLQLFVRMYQSTIGDYWWVLLAFCHHCKSHWSVLRGLLDASAFLSIEGFLLFFINAHLSGYWIF